MSESTKTLQPSMDLYYGGMGALITFSFVMLQHIAIAGSDITTNMTATIVIITALPWLLKMFVSVEMNKERTYSFLTTFAIYLGTLSLAAIYGKYEVVILISSVLYAISTIVLLLKFHKESNG